MKRLVFAAVLPVAFACAGADDASTSPNVFADGLVAIVENVTAPGWPRAALSITTATVTGDTLRLRVQFVGGCARHRFALLIGGAFMESHPVQVHARLAHDDGGDGCEALLTRDLAFDLTRLKLRYPASYGTGPATIVINIVDQSRSLRYTFD